MIIPVTQTGSTPAAAKNLLVPGSNFSSSKLIPHLFNRKRRKVALKPQTRSNTRGRSFMSKILKHSRRAAKPEKSRPCSNKSQNFISLDERHSFPRVKFNYYYIKVLIKRCETPRQIQNISHQFRENTLFNF